MAKKYGMGYWENVVCSVCGEPRDVYRMSKTPKGHSFHCCRCGKTVKARDNRQVELLKIKEVK